MSNTKKFDESTIDFLALDIIKSGSEKAIEELEYYFLPICLRISGAMIKTYKINLDTSEPGDYLFIIHETILKSIAKYNPYIGDYKSYFLAAFVTNLYALFEKEYAENIALFNAISLDAYLPKSNKTRTYHDVIPCSLLEDPRTDYDYEEMRAVLFSDTKIEGKLKEMSEDKLARMRLQRQVLLLKYYGCTIEEIAKQFGISKYVVKRIMVDDDSYMPLGRLKKIFNKK